MISEFKIYYILGFNFKDDLIPNKELIRNYNIFSDVIEAFWITIVKYLEQWLQKIQEEYFTTNKNCDLNEYYHNDIYYQLIINSKL